MALSDVKDIVKRAMKWGHKAIAITDHGDVQAFPDANHTVPSDSDFKVIYGVEAYLVDDLKEMVTDSQRTGIWMQIMWYLIWRQPDLVRRPTDHRDRCGEGAERKDHGPIFSAFVNPQVPIPFRIDS